MMDSPRLHVVMYHYIRDPQATRFPRLHALAVEAFVRQLDSLGRQYEMVTLPVALEFLAGRYHPRRDLCLLTFDDGVKEHCTTVTPLLAQRRIPGLFFLITGCIEECRVATVHKNHLLMASLDFADYRQRLLAEVAALAPDLESHVDLAEARRIYRWDNDDVAAFKYWLNFHTSPAIREAALDRLCTVHLGREADVSAELYLNWEEARQMQAAGMLLGGHSHRHEPLAKLNRTELQADLAACRRLLTERLDPQPLWPFSYPYGKPTDSYDVTTVRTLVDLRFACGFSTVVGSNAVGQDPFSLRRIDAKDVAA